MGFENLFLNRNVVGQSLIANEKKKLEQKYKFPASM